MAQKLCPVQTRDNICLRPVAEASLAQCHLPVSMGALSSEEFSPSDKAVRAPKSKGVQVRQRYLWLGVHLGRGS